MFKKRKKKRIFERAAATLMSILTVTSSLFTGVTLPQNTVYAATTTTDVDINTAIVKEAAKYLGYGYSQSSRLGANGTFDCSGLVYTVLNNLGVTMPGGVPQGTDAWISWFTSTAADGQQITYNGKAYTIKTAANLTEFESYRNNDAYAGYAIILKNATTYSDLAIAGGGMDWNGCGKLCTQYHYPALT